MLKQILNRNDLLDKAVVSVRAPVTLLGKKVEKDNLSVIDWHMPASFDPMRYLISLPKDDNTSRMVRDAGHFVVNFMGREHWSTIYKADKTDGLFTDLFALFKFSKAESRSVESPRIKEAEAFLECEVEHELSSGDHVLFLGKVVGTGNNQDSFS